MFPVWLQSIPLRCRNAASWSAAGKISLIGAVLMVIAVAPNSAARSPGCERSLEQWTVRHFDTGQGLPLDTVYALASDRHGFLWAGTEDGLARFDGDRFERIDLQSVLGSAPAFVRALTGDGAGRVYAGISSSGVVAIDTDTGRPLSLALPLRSSIEALHLQQRHLLIGARGEPLRRLSLERGQSSSLGDAEAPVRAVAGRSAGGFWIGRDGGGIDRLEDGRLGPSGIDGLPTPFVSDLIEDRDGRLWIGTREGLFSWEDGTLTHHANDAGLAPQEHVVSLHLDAGGHLWAGTGGDGVLRLCRGQSRFERLGAEGELGRAHINDILEDRDGGVWLASGGEGLYRLVRGAAVPIGPDQGLPGYPVLPITQDRSGAMWLGTFGGGVVRMRGDELQVFDESNSALQGDRVLSLAPAAEEEGVWVGTRVGLNRISGGEVSQPIGGDFTTVSALLAEPGRLWIGSVDGLFVASEGTVEAVEASRGSLSGHVLLLRRDSDGRLWVSTDSDGLFHLDEEKGRFEPVPFSGELPSSSIYDLAEQPQGAVWLAGSRGLVRVRDGRVAVVDSRQGLIENLAFSILDDRRGHFWLGGNRGVFRVARDQLEAAADGRLERVDVTHFDRGSGMPRSETNGGFQYAAWRDDTGRLWYPTVGGAAVFDPSEAAHSPARLEVRLTGAATDRGELGVGATLPVPAGADWLRLRYTAPYLHRPEALEFRYRLEGLETDWFVTRERSALYRRLPPGSYRFEVQARTDGGTWSAAQVHALDIPRLWYQNPLVQLAALALGMAVIAVLVYCFARRRRRKREQLAQAQKLEAVGLLAGGIAHDFNNSLAAIMSGTEILSDHLPADSPARRDAARILDAAERAAGLTRQLLIFARRQQVEPQWLDLGQELQAARDFLERLLPRTVELSWNSAGRLGFCRIDRVQLQQVLMNLIVNARDAMAGAGRIAVSAGIADAQVVSRAGLPGRRSFAAIEVADNGPGLERGIETRIFEPFFTTKSGNRGTGLGLAVAYGIVEQAGGWIGVRSQPGRGATFTVLLPVEPAVVDQGDDHDNR